MEEAAAVLPGVVDSTDTTIVGVVVMAEVVATTATVQGTMMATVLVALATTHMIAAIATATMVDVTTTDPATSIATQALAMTAMAAVEMTDVEVGIETRDAMQVMATRQLPEIRVSLTPAAVVDPTKAATIAIPVGNFGPARRFRRERCREVRPRPTACSKFSTSPCYRR